MGNDQTMAARGESESWQSGKTLAEGMRYMFDNKVATDVSIEVGPTDGKTVIFEAHKFVLIASSEVFECMFSSGMMECRGTVAKVRVEDIDPDIFKELLNYMYCAHASMCPKSAAYLMYAAKKYMLTNLVKDCRECLLKNLNISNTIDILDQSLLLDEPELKSKCFELISVNAVNVLTGAEILSASRLVLEAVLEADCIPVRESVIYETAVNWAKRQLQSAKPGEIPTGLQIREALGNLLYKIRFPVMKATEFAEISSGNSLLTAEEKESVYYFLVTEKKDGLLKFPTERRIGEEVWIDRATVVCSSVKWRSTSDFLDAINFQTDQDILLTGLGLYSGCSEKGYNVDVQILQSSNSLYKMSATVPYTGNSTPSKVLLDEPVVIRARVIYSLKVWTHSFLYQYASSCRAVCKKETVTFTFYKHSESEYTTVTRGQIPRLYFSFL